MVKLESNVEDIIQKFEQIKRNVEENSGEHVIPFNNLFTSEFMNNYTDFDSIDNLIRSSCFPIRSSEDIENLPSDEWNRYIQKHTRFSSWDEMVQTAAKEYFAKKIGLL
ncbi:MAG: hypothetical protein HPY61_13555 [Methanotrichaceae archaeon]|nr:hypothetical protein [Methanotrichaceae archaeon]